MTWILPSEVARVGTHPLFGLDSVPDRNVRGTRSSSARPRRTRPPPAPSRSSPDDSGLRWCGSTRRPTAARWRAPRRPCSCWRGRYRPPGWRARSMEPCRSGVCGRRSTSPRRTTDELYEDILRLNPFAAEPARVSRRRSSWRPASDARLSQQYLSGWSDGFQTLSKQTRHDVLPRRIYEYQLP